MNVALKKTDKMILAIGIIIIIIAAAGIVAYSTIDWEDEKTEPEMKTYKITWTEETNEMDISDYVSNSEPYSLTKIISVNDGFVLTDVEFEVNWEDDSTYGLVRDLGLDTLGAKIYKSGHECDEETTTGSGNMTFNFRNINDEPFLDSVEAENSNEADDKIIEDFDGQNEETYEIEISISTGEKVRRPLKYLRDKGNDFEIKIVYTYYSYEFEEENTEDEDKNSGILEDDIISEFYRTISSGRGFI